MQALWSESRLWPPKTRHLIRILIERPNSCLIARPTCLKPRALVIYSEACAPNQEPRNSPWPAKARPARNSPDIEYCPGGISQGYLLMFMVYKFGVWGFRFSEPVAGLLSKLVFVSGSLNCSHRLMTVV